MIRQPLRSELQGLKELNRILKEDENFFNSERQVQTYTSLSNAYVPKNLIHEKGLYSTHIKIFTNYMRSVVSPRLQEKHGEFLLREFVRSWRNIEHMTSSLTYRLEFVCPSDVVSARIFRGWVYEKQRKGVRDAVIQMVDEDREGKKIDRLLLKNVVGVLLEIGDMDIPELPSSYHVEDLERHLIEKTSAYYSLKASKWIRDFSSSKYIRTVQECLTNEKERVSKCLCSIMATNLVQRIEHELLTLQQKKLLEKEGSGFRGLLAAGSFEDLCSMFRIYKKLPGCLKPIADIFKDYVREEGIAVIQHAEEAAMSNNGVVQEQILVRKLIVLLDGFKGYVSACFEDHYLFCNAMNEAFEEFCNKNVAEISMAEIFATFFDTTLRRMKKKGIDESTKDTLEKGVRFLSYISEKDFFSEFCRRKLGRGLLFSGEIPNNVLQKLKQQLFSGLVNSAMEGMVKDLILAEKDHNSFMEYLRENPDLEPGFDFSVTVLATNFWPIYISPLNMNLPLEMGRCLQSYTVFYNSKTKHRKLTWIYSLGQCRLLGRFDKNTIELIVSTHQAAVLLLFNWLDQLRFSDIASQLNLFPRDLCSLLHSLCLDKYKILNKYPDTSTISQSDIFEFNANFIARTRKIHVPQPVLVEEQDHELKKEGEDVNIDRRYAIDAAIVRIMKSRKVAVFGELVSECVDRLKQRFRPDVKAIKIRVEDLITRDFLERDLADPNTLRYLA